jgi:hypothetical protein
MQLHKTAPELNSSRWPYLSSDTFYSHIKLLAHTDLAAPFLFSTPHIPGMKHASASISVHAMYIHNYTDATSVDKLLCWRASPACPRPFSGGPQGTTSICWLSGSSGSLW